MVVGASVVSVSVSAVVVAAAVVVVVVEVVEAIPSEDGLVRSVKLQLATTQLDAKGRRLTDLTFLNRPVHNLILLLEV